MTKEDRSTKTNNTPFDICTLNFFRHSSFVIRIFLRVLRASVLI
jgi:hypothetical protein